MGLRPARLLVGAAVAACLLLAPAPGSASKLDARLRAARAAAASGGFAPAAGGAAPAAGPRYRVLLRVSPGTSPSALRSAAPGLTLGAAAGDVITAAADAAALDALEADSRVLAVEAAARRRPYLEVSLSSKTVSGVYHGTLRNGLADVAGLTGAGVVVGVIDTGIDWQHRDFSVDGAPDTTRILAIWDQTISSHAGGAFPAGFSYGAEYVKAVIDSKLAGGADVINTKDESGHGTHVASIAAGDGSATNGALPAGRFAGYAPGADLVIVKTTFLDTDIVDGMAYITAKAAAAGKRAVINLSLGSQAGPHDGTSTFETGVAAVAASTPVFVAIGNDHARAPHAKTVFAGLGTSNFTASVSAPVPDVAEMEFWHPSGDAYTVTATLFGSGGAVTAVSGGSNSGVISGHTVEVFNAQNSGHPSGDKQIYVRVTKSGGVTMSQFTAALTRTNAGGSGRVDGFVDPAASGVEWASFVDNTLTMGVPASAQSVFPVGSYATKNSWDAFDGYTYSFVTQAALGSSSLFSAVGPTRDGRQAPEFMAPGDGVVAALSANATSYSGSCNMDACYTVIDDRHRLNAGTSMAAPAAAGVAAARLQAQPGLTVAELRAVMRALARSDAATGSLPNAAYGYGKLVASPQPVTPPSGFVGYTLGTTSISWSWGAVTGAPQFNVYYATNTGSLLATVSTTPFLHAGLAANTTYGLFVRGMAGGADGPGTFVSTATYADPVAPGAAAGHVSSVTLSFTPCPAAPTALSCGGYALEVSTDPAFAGATFSSVTLSRAASQLTVSGLASLTTYYLRLATLNPFGGGHPVAAGSTRTISDLLAPIGGSVTEVSSVSARFSWGVGSNPAGLTYVAQASSAPDYSGVVFSSSTRNLEALFAALSVNTSYYFRVAAVSGPHLTFGPVPTDAVAATAPAAPFTAVSSDTLTVSWSSGGNPPGTLYSADVSALPDFSGGVVSSITRAVAASLTGLAPNTLYYARVTAFGHDGTASAATALGSTATLAQPVVPLGGAFSAQTTDGFAFAFGTGANPPGTRFIVRVSTDAAFTVTHASSDTANAFASFSGLLSNQLYWVQAAALNLSGAVGAYSAAQSTATSVGPPGAAATAVSSRSASSLTLAWTRGTLGAGTQYLAEVSSEPAWGSVAASSATASTGAVLSGLTSDTVYYGRVRALSANPPTPDGAPVVVATAATLAPAPVPAAFSGVGASSLTVNWLAGASSGYHAEVSLSPSFSSALSSVVAAGATSASFTGLQYAATYYARVGALNSEGIAHYAPAGSTTTFRPALSSAPASGGAVALLLTQPFPVFTSAALSAEPGTFPNGVYVTVAAGTSLDLTDARGAAALTPLGAGIGFEISASGLQPLKPVRFTLAYDPAQVPAGQDARRLRLARYDEASGLWQLQPSAVDPKTSTIVASLDHFSVFAPFFTTAGTAPDQVLIYPNPWEHGASGDQAAQTMTFASLPDGANVKVLTMAGELVWEGVAGPSGVLTWDGRNRHGVKAGSATYYVVIKSGSRSVTRRAVLIR